MLALPGNAKIFLFQDPVDMRKGFEGLGAAVVQTFQEPLTTGAYFIFLNRSRDRMKVLYWDVDGLVIWYKRLEKGHFGKKNEEKLDRRAFFMLLEDITPKKLPNRFKID